MTRELAVQLARTYATAMRRPFWVVTKDGESRILDYSAPGALGVYPVSNTPQRQVTLGPGQWTGD